MSIPEQHEIVDIRKG